MVRRSLPKRPSALPIVEFRTGTVVVYDDADPARQALIAGMGYIAVKRVETAAELEVQQKLGIGYGTDECRDPEIQEIAESRGGCLFDRPGPAEVAHAARVAGSAPHLTA